MGVTTTTNSAATYVPIATQTLSTSASTVVFSGIAQTYTDLILVTTVTTGSGGQVTAINFNTDVTGTGTSYSGTNLGGSGSSASSGKYTNTSYMVTYFIAGTSTSTPAITTFQIMNYANTTTYKTTLVRGSVASGEVVAGAHLWSNTAAINKLTILPVGSGSTFSAGSTFTLYGIKAA